MDKPPANADKPRPEPSDADDPNVLAHDILQRVLRKQGDSARPSCPASPNDKTDATSQ